MREWINLFEKTHSMRTGMGEEVIAIQNPAPQQLTVMLERYHRLRGMIDDEGQVYIWNAMTMTHFQAEMQLGIKIEIGFYLGERLDGRTGCRWSDYSGEGQKPEDNDAFNRMMKRTGVVLGNTEGVFESVEKTITCYHVTPEENVSSIIVHGLTPQTGPRSGKMNDHGIYLFVSQEDAENAIMNWLGDEFPEDEQLILLKVTIPNDANVTREAFEIVCHSLIPPNNITVIGEI